MGANMTPDFIPTYVRSLDKVHPGALKYYEDNDIEVRDLATLLR
jgi:hypothetical protein